MGPLAALQREVASKSVALHDAQLSVDRFGAELPYNPRVATCFQDPLPDHTTAMLAMAAAMLFVASIGYGLTMVGAGCAQQGEQVRGRVPKMVILDAVRAWVVFNIIQHHQETPFYIHCNSDGLVLMSGFLLAATQGTRRQTYDLRGAAAFAAHRLGRLAPGYFLLLSLMAARSLFDPQRMLTRVHVAWPANALFLQSMLPVHICGSGPGTGFWLPCGAVRHLGHTWYVSVTMLHALLFPWIFNLFRAVARSPASAALALGGLFAARYAVEAARAAGTDVVGDFHVLHRNTAPVRVVDMATGMAVAALCDLLPPAVQRWRGWAWVLPLCLAHAIASETIYNTKVLVNMSWSLFLCAARCAAECSPLWTSSWKSLDGGLNALEWLVVKVGQYSWGAYLYQWVAYELLEFAHLPRALEWAPGVLSFILAIPADHFLDAPVARAVRQRLYSKPSPAG